MLVQVNTTDYTNSSNQPIIVIERAKRYGGWSVPAWEEMGMGDLEGDIPDMSGEYCIGWSWSSVDKAQAAIDQAKKDGFI